MENVKCIQVKQYDKCQCPSHTQSCLNCAPIFYPPIVFNKSMLSHTFYPLIFQFESFIERDSSSKNENQLLFHELKSVVRFQILSFLSFPLFFFLCLSQDQNKIHVLNLTGQYVESPDFLQVLFFFHVTVLLRKQLCFLQAGAS